MNKWTKGFLIFGVTASILGTCAMVTGAAAGGVHSLLTLSDKPVYNSTEVQDTITETVDKLDISLSHHSLEIIESPDERIHITYYKRLTGKTDFKTLLNQGTLTITDRVEEQERNMGNGVDFLLRASKAITSRYSLIRIALPKTKPLKEVTVAQDIFSETVQIVGLQTDNLNLKTKNYVTSIQNSKIGKGKIETDGLVRVGDSELTDTQIESDGRTILKMVSVHGKVTLDSHRDTDIQLAKEELDRIHLEISNKEGSIYHTPYKKDKGGYHSDIDEKEVSNPYSYGSKDSKDQLIIKNGYGTVYLMEIQ